ncbi:hypothetical protein LOD99_5823 [Oopsacas minuta]|uniref:DNA 3'-5' helicase n=1 Tax=Oopsacas minuta TaxID=111878 RepID=A0AAV7JNW9_9METZ|nr:hypothetical protein LOD99_5823 [Oopsacas minuta]
MDDDDEILSSPDVYYEDDVLGSESDYDNIDCENIPQLSLTTEADNCQVTTQTACLPNQTTQPSPPHFPPNQSHLEVLKSKFNHNEFRAKQWKIISVILDYLNSSRDPSKIIDQFFIAPSGFGKSICYQFVPVYTNSLALVISPLKSLMLDQFRLMTESGISAVILSPTSIKSGKTLARLFNSEFNIAYITPELCINRGQEFILDLHSKVRICLVAIDEAHCVSCWGHDFRPKYGRLSLLREWLSDVPFLALTATAGNFVTKDIIQSLSLKNTKLHRIKLNRPNLYFEVHNKQGIDHDMKKLLRNANSPSLPEKYSFGGPCIVYCLTRDLTEYYCKHLKNLGVKCDSYHAGMNDRDRKETYDKFVRGEIECIVATVAFGMGIDKPDVRIIIHYGAPKDLESYMQEAGRAGRDCSPSRCIIFYRSSDFRLINRILVSKTRKQSPAYIQHCSNLVKKVQSFLTSNECRRKQLLANLDEELPVVSNPSNDCCDICSSCCRSILKRQHSGNEVDLFSINQVTEDTDGSSSSKKKKV